MTPNERYLAITTWRRIKEAQRIKERRLDRYERDLAHNMGIANIPYMGIINSIDKLEEINDDAQREE